ncbi:MAG TPA: hypothetical protein VMS65_13290, partial [Polyangiaceae bacterium]|nr:hypothetical protein [Polyangiaceae bacterium]
MVRRSCAFAIAAATVAPLSACSAPPAAGGSVETPKRSSAEQTAAGRTEPTHGATPKPTISLERGV